MGEPNSFCMNCERQFQSHEGTPCRVCKEKIHARKRGLKWAGIEPLDSAVFWKDASPLAMLGHLEISHSHNYYWIVRGKVPLGVAAILYADCAGQDLIRAGGHGLCPAPETQAEWVLPSGRKVIPTSNKAECDRLLQIGGELLRGVAQNILDTCDFSDDPASVGASGYVDLYHIDSDLGLRVFADIIRREMLTDPPKSA